MTDAQLDAIIVALNKIVEAMEVMQKQIQMLAPAQTYGQWANQVPVQYGNLHTVPDQYRHCDICGGRHLNATTCPRLIPGKEIGT